MENELPNEFNLKYALKYISVSGKQWEYLSKGNGRITFLILPGGGQYAQSQFIMVEEFSGEYKIIVPTIFDANSLNECSRNWAGKIQGISTKITKNFNNQAPKR